MTPMTGRGLKLKWIGLLALFAVFLLIVTDVTILQVYPGELRRSFILIQGIALIAGILLGFLSTGKWVSPTDTETRGPSQSERASKDGGEQYWEVFENSKDMVYITSADGWVIDINPAGVEMLGYTSKDELTKVHPKEFYFSSSDRKKFINEAVNSGFVRNFETKLKRKGGVAIDVLMTVSARKDASGNPIGYEGFVKNISDRKKVEEELRKSEERYRTIIENIQDGYFEIDLAGNYAFMNDAECVNMGYAREELIGMNNRQYTDQENAKKLFQAFSKIYRTGEPIKGLDLEVIRKDGTKAFNEISVSLIRDSEGKPIGFRGISRDVTERKRTEEALRQSEEKYRTILENIQEAYYELDLAGNFTFINDALCRHLGYSREELIGMNNRRYQDAAGAERSYQLYKEVYETGKSIEILDSELVRKDGTKGIYEMSVSLIRDSEGKPIGFRGVSRDITERKRAEEALRGSEERATRFSQENAIMAEIGRIVSSTLNIKDVYERFAEEVRRLIPFDRVSVNTMCTDGASVMIAYAFGVQIEGAREGTIVAMERPLYEDIVSKRTSILIQTEDESGLAERYPNFVRHFKAGLRSMIATPLISQDRLIGILHIQSLKPNVYTDSDVRLAERVGNQIAGAIANAQLFAARQRAEEALRQSEEKYRTILESIQEGYFEDDLIGNLTFFNDVLCRHLGYTREELMGMNYLQRVDEKDAKKLAQSYGELYRTGEPIKALEAGFVRKDGSKLIAEFSASLIKNSEGKPIGFRSISRDVTDRKKIEEQLFQAEKLRAVGEMASGVAHDFNNALAAILGNTQLLLFNAPEGELKETLKIIEKVAKDSGRTVRRLQDFTRRGGSQRFLEVDINAIVRDSVEMTKPRWKDEAQSGGRRIEIVTNLKDLPPVFGSASELREVITQMIFNAVEAMPEGGKIEIRTFEKQRDIYIQISDSGIGIGEEAKKRIFEPFFTTKPFTNTGLGLSVSYGIVKRLGGEIEVESKAGIGTTFTIILPVGEEAKEETGAPQVIEKEKKARILVIDDEELVRSVLLRTLAQADHQVTLAEDGRKGVQLFKEGKFDLVLTDLGMPGLSGWEVCKMIKEMSPHTPVGMITGWADERNREKFEEYGLDFFISKPFDLEQILNVVAQVMETRKN